MTNEALANEVGVSVRLVQKWRSGAVRPRYENLVLLARALGHDVAWFFSSHPDHAPDHGSAA